MYSGMSFGQGRVKVKIKVGSRSRSGQGQGQRSVKVKGQDQRQSQKVYFPFATNLFLVPLLSEKSSIYTTFQKGKK